MRYAGKYGALCVGVQKGIVEHFATGASRVVQPEISAQFKVGGLQPFEREHVLARWAFNGLYQEQDEMTMVQPDYRIGVYDSKQDQAEHGWPDETRELVEQELNENARLYDNVMVLPVAPVDAPWPNYDEFRGSVGALLKRLDEDGYDLEQVLVYERAVQNRPALVEALELRLAGGVESEPQETVLA